MIRVEVYDNGGRTTDRYTVIIDRKIYKMNAEGTIDIFAREVDTDESDFSYLGARRSLVELPLPVLDAVEAKVRALFPPCAQDVLKGTAPPGANSSA